LHPADESEIAETTNPKSANLRLRESRQALVAVFMNDIVKINNTFF
jgi:hypothetical protein